MSYRIITSHPWSNEERELFQLLQRQIIDAVDHLWQFETSLLLLDAAEEWREKSNTETDALDAIEFFLCTWIRSHKPRIKNIHQAVDTAYVLSSQLDRLLKR